MYLWEWSLFNEVFFYLLFPLLYFIFKNYSVKILFFILFLSFIISYWSNIFTKTYWLFDLYWTPITHMYSFLIWLFLFKFKDLSLSNKQLNIIKYLNIVFYLPLIYFFINYWYLYIFPFFILNIWITVFLFIKWIFKFHHWYLYDFLKFTWLISYSLYLINYWFYILSWIFYKNFIFPYFWYNSIYEIIYIFWALIIIYFLSYLTYKFIEQNWILLWKKIIEKYSN